MNKKGIFVNQIDATDEEIDRMVYELVWIMGRNNK
jgi:hypothetical protein